MIEIGRERDEAFGGEAVGDALDVVVEAPPLLDDDDGGMRAGAIGLSEVPHAVDAVRGEFDGCGGDHGRVSQSFGRSVFQHVGTSAK